MNFNVKLSEKEKKNWLNSNFKLSELNTLGHIPYFLNEGWAVHFNHFDIIHKRITVQCPPHFSVCFVKGIKHTWRIRNGWQTADLIDGFYSNHKPIKDVFELLNIDKNG